MNLEITNNSSLKCRVSQLLFNRIYLLPRNIYKRGFQIKIVLFLSMWIHIWKWVTLGRTSVPSNCVSWLSPWRACLATTVFSCCTRQPCFLCSKRRVLMLRCVVHLPFGRPAYEPRAGCFPIGFLSGVYLWGKYTNNLLLSLASLRWMLRQ